MKSYGPVVIVLAAGKSERFYASGATQHKLEAELCGKRVLDRTLEAVQQSALPWYQVQPNASASGMGDSIRRGVLATQQAQGWLILHADLPLVEKETLLRVAKALRDDTVIVPRYCMQNGHPVAFGRHYLPHLTALSGETGGRDVVEHARQCGQLLTIEVDDIGIVLDIDTLADLQAAKEVYLEREGRKDRNAVIKAGGT